MEIHIRIFPPDTKRWRERGTAKTALADLLSTTHQHIYKAFITREAYAAGAQGFLDQDGNVCCLVEINKTED